MNMDPSGEVRAEPGTVLLFNFVVPSPVPMPTLIAASARALPGAYLVSQPFLFFPSWSRRQRGQRNAKGCSFRWLFPSGPCVFQSRTSRSDRSPDPRAWTGLMQ